MLFESKNVSVTVGPVLTKMPLYNCKEAVIVEVENGKSALRCKRTYNDDNYSDVSELCLNDKPIIQADESICPTCESLLATGYGIDNIECSELSGISDAVNAKYGGIEKAVSTLVPILGLLEDGVYVLADYELFPTDGNGNFFWNVPNELTQNPATTSQHRICKEKFDYMSGEPAFIYPSQSTKKFDEIRVEYYQELLKNKDDFPRAIAYYGRGFYNVLLDGHHKACACALNGELLSTLIIIPCTGMSSRYGENREIIKEEILFSSFSIPLSFFTDRQKNAIKKTMAAFNKQENVVLEKYEILTKKWGAEYLQTSEKYPTVDEFAREVFFEIAKTDEKEVKELLQAPYGENAEKLSVLINYYNRVDKDKALEVSLCCAKKSSDKKLLETAFKVLATFKDNEEVEKIFINQLLEDKDPNSLLLKIANEYWSV